ARMMNTLPNAPVSVGTSKTGHCARMSTGNSTLSRAKLSRIAARTARFRQLLARYRHGDGSGGSPRAGPRLRVIGRHDQIAGHALRRPPDQEHAPFNVRNRMEGGNHDSRPVQLPPAYDRGRGIQAPVDPRHRGSAARRRTQPDSDDEAQAGGSGASR